MSTLPTDNPPQDNISTSTADTVREPVAPPDSAPGVSPAPAPKDPLPELLARISAIEADIAQSKAKISEALGKLLAAPPTL